MKKYEKKGTLLKVDFSSPDKDKFMELVSFVKTLEKSRFNTDFPKKWSVLNTESNIKKLEEAGFVDALKKVEVHYEPFTNHLTETIPEKGFETLYPYQKEALKFIKHNKGKAVVSLPMGSGKTFVALYYTKMDVSVNSVLIICPSTIKLQWVKECKKVLPKYTVTTLNSHTPYIPEMSNFYVINWDIISHWKNVLCQMRFDLIVSDEVQAIGNKSERTKAYKAIVKAQKSKHIAMSGTPIRSKVRQFYNILSLMDNEVFGNEFKFLNRYCAPKYTPFGMKYDGSSNIPELREKIKPIVFVKEKSDIFKDSPKKKRIIVPMELTDYNAYSKLLSELGDPTENKLMDLQKSAYHLKKDAVQKWVEQTLESVNKIVLFAWHRLVVEHLHSAFPQSVVVYGGMKLEEKDGAVEKFKTDENTRIMIINIGACVGLDGLQDVCSNAAFVELALTESDMKQAEDRLDRIRQKESVNIYYLVGSETIDEKYAAIIEKNSRLNNELLYGGAGDEITILSAMEK